MEEYKDQRDFKYYKICKTCNKVFYKRKCISFKTWEKQKFCCFSCRRPSTKENLKNRIFTKLKKPIELKCKNCKKSFFVKTLSAAKVRIFCSISCVTEYNQKNKNYWDNDKDRKNKLIKKQKDKVKNNIWMNPIFASGALEKMKLSKKANPTIVSEKVLEQSSKLAAQRLVDGTNSNLGYYKYGNIGYFFSNKNNKDLRYRSSFEKKAYEILEDDSTVRKYKVEPFRIRYKINNKFRYYVPDLLVVYKDSIKLIEVKPLDKLMDNITIVKKEYAEKYCLLHNIDKYEIWTEVILFPGRKI